MRPRMGINDSMGFTLVELMIVVMVLGILVFRIRETFASMDVSKLNELKW